MDRRPVSRFRLVRLESRVAPGCLLWQGELVDTIAAVGATYGDESTTRLFRADRIASLRAAFSARFDARQAPDEVAMPVWAEKFLDQVERELAQEARSEVAASASDADRQARLDQLMSEVNRQLAQSAVVQCESGANASDTMPEWAETLLQEIRHEVAHA